MSRRVEPPALRIVGILTAGPLPPGVSGPQRRARVRRSRARTALLPIAVLAVVFLTPLAALLVSTHLLGWQLQVIETGSMAPRYPAGSLAIIEPLDPSAVRVGMTIVFDDPLAPGRTVAHRVVETVGSSAWSTKGDANRSRDPIPVQAAAIHGRVRWAIPGAGRWIDAIHGPVAVVGLVAVPLVLLVATEVAHWRRRRTRRVPQPSPMLARP